MNKKPKRIVLYRDVDGIEPFGQYLWALGKQGKHGTVMAITQFLKDIEDRGINLMGSVQIVSPEVFYVKPYPFPDLFIFLGMLENGVWILLNHCISDKIAPPRAEINLAKKRLKRYRISSS